MRDITSDFLSRSDFDEANQLKWDLRFLRIAREVSTWSKDPSTKVGAVIVDTSNQIVSTGYNGLPKYVEDDYRLLSNRDLKYKCILHAEENAILHAERSRMPYGCIYLYPFLPCSNCASRVIQAGISRVVSFRNVDTRWEESINFGKTLFESSNTQVVELDRKLIERII